MIIFNSNVLKFGGFWLGFGSSPTPPPIYRINVPPTVQHGTVSVNPTEGPTGTLITISTVPDTGYELDTISLTGAELINGNQFYINGSDVTVNVTFTESTPVDPYNPLNLPANTVRVRTSDGNAPSKAGYATYETATLVSGTTDVYDVYKSGTDFGALLFYSENVKEVLGANTTGITSMDRMFYGINNLTSVTLFDTSSVTNMSFMFVWCNNLTSVPLYDTSNVTNMQEMFNECHSLTTVPLFNTSNVTNMKDMFYDCYDLTNVPLFNTSNVTNMQRMFYECNNLTTVPLFNTSKVTNMDSMFYNCTLVQSGALALYQQASSQANPPSSHSATFYNCGSNTTTGAAELAQIHWSWK